MLPIIFSAIPVILQILSGAGLVPATVTNLTSNLLTPVENLIATIKSGSTVTDDVLASLAALSGVIAVLKATTGLSPEVLTQINNVDLDVTAALKAYANAEAGLNLSLYGQIQPV